MQGPTFCEYSCPALILLRGHLLSLPLSLPRNAGSVSAGSVISRLQEVEASGQGYDFQSCVMIQAESKRGQRMSKEKWE